MLEFIYNNIGLLLKVGIVVVLYISYRKMAKAGSPFFKIGYFLYTKTPIGHVYYRREVAKALQKYNNEAHSITEPVKFNDLTITPIAMSMDNYSYLVTDERAQVSVLVDPADPTPVQRVLEKQGITPSAILTTHKHWDHSDGNCEFKKKFRGIQVYGGAMDQVPGVTHRVSDGDRLQVGDLRFTVHYTPGHTVGHVVYLLDGVSFNSPPHLFSGDHLFLAGIGRMFEGSASTMLNSLDKVCALPSETMIWPGHEYAVDNLEFAATVDPQNQPLLQKFEWAKERRREKQITSPSTLAEEKTYNPFLRTCDETLRKEVGFEGNVDESADETRARLLALLRTRKDKFKYKL